MSEHRSQGKKSWVRFDDEGRSASGKTRVWSVASAYEKADLTEQHMPLGMIQWYAAWRRYGFFPAPQTVFEQKCLRDIADFCEQQTRAHKGAA